MTADDFDVEAARKRTQHLRGVWTPARLLHLAQANEMHAVADALNDYHAALDALENERLTSAVLRSALDSILDGARRVLASLDEISA